MRRAREAGTIVTVLFGLVAVVSATPAAGGFDHEYRAYAALLEAHLVGPRVDYARLARHRDRLTTVAQQFGAVPADAERSWSRDERLAFWVNAYNVFTLQAIIDHYPIRRRFSVSALLYPASSIRQIPGVWDELTWRAAGRDVTLDEIEHAIVRPTFQEPRIHFAINCASVSCPPLRPEPYRAADLDRQLDEAARAYLASDLGLRVDGSTLAVSSIFDWYGDDFVARYAERVPGERSAKERAILGFIAEYGPPAAARLARSGTASIRFLDYDWSLNDVQ